MQYSKSYPSQSFIRRISTDNHSKTVLSNPEPRAEARRRLESEWFAEFGYAPRRRRRLCDEEGIENLPTEVVTVDHNEVIINIRECSGVLHSRGLNKQMERAPLSKKELVFGLQFPDDDTTLFEKTRTVRKTKGPHETRKSMACIKRRRAA